MKRIHVEKSYQLDDWELHLDLDSSPKKILETVLDCVTDDLEEADPTISVDDDDRIVIWVDANSHEINVLVDELDITLYDEHYDSAIKSLEKLIARIRRKRDADLGPTGG